MTTQRILTGIKPTGLPHIGNYFGAIKPALSSDNSHEKLFFIADYHALTSIKNKEELDALTFQVAAAWLALGLDPNHVIFYKQSDIPEIFELHWILSCLAPKGLLNRAHAYKAAVDDNLQKNNDADKNINHGLFSYPVLMAADILLFGSTHVPVGADQKQHVEIARDLAEAFNHHYGELLTLPSPIISKTEHIIPGTDSRKMSKNYNNTIPIFATEKELKKTIMSIQTDSTPLEEPKNPDNCTLFSLYCLFAEQEEINNMRQAYLKGGLGYGHVKKELLERVLAHFKLARKNFTELTENKEIVYNALQEGEKKARQIASDQLSTIKKAIGVKP